MEASFTIIPLYAALLGLMFVVITLRVGVYRLKNRINIGDGGDPELLRRIRGQGNFIESVPIALILLFAMEAMGASAAWLHGLGAALLLGRLLHYPALTQIGPFITRPMGMVATLSVVLIASLWIRVALL